MSRLIVKGLPARFDDSNLRDLFKPLGEVTDARVIKTKEGRSRCFGFVGFRTKQDASKAKHAMHKAFVDTKPVIVEIAHAKGDEAIPRPWSRYSVGSSQYDRINNPRQPTEYEREEHRSKDEKPEKHEATENQSRELVDKEFEAFEEVASANRFQGVKTNDMTTLVQSKRNGRKGQVVERKHVTFKDDDDSDEDDELYEDIPKKKPTETDPTKLDECPISETGNETALNDSISDMDYFKSKMVQSDAGNDDDEDTKDENEDEDSDDGDDDNGNPGDSNSDSEKAHSNDKTSAGNDSEKKASDDGADKNQKTKVIKAAEKESNEIDPGETGRLMVRNLAFSVTEEELETVFESFGALSEVHIVRNSSNNKSRGMGFVQFCIPENAAKALIGVDGSFHCGRILHVLPARPKPTSHKMSILGPKNDASNSNGGGGAGNSGFKQEREQAQKDAARTGNDDSAQHTLHMSADAVAQVAADKHGVSKADLLGTKRGESGIAAVRLAIAEATIQSEARTFLSDNGIDVDLLLKLSDEMNADTVAAKRKRQSRRAFLVKNLPARTTRHALMDIFVKFGTIAKLVVVPSGLLAVVQFDTASDARRAYNGLAYTKFKDTPLYLEWLPAEAIRDTNSKSDSEVKQSESSKPDVAKDDASPKQSVKSSLKTKPGSISDPVANVRSDADEENQKAVDDSELAGSCSVYVKNLSFETRDEQLRNHFRGILRRRPEVLKSLRSAKVALKKGPEGKESQTLSAGFGFLEFKTMEDAKEVVKLGQNSTLDGHVLRLQLSIRDANDERGGSKGKKKRTREEAGSKTKAGPKLMVRNVAFEATRRDIRQLFETFGQLKTVRMPKKMDGSHRGFAFVEFVSKNEAISAYDALRDTHLYGRHLVIEYADQDGPAAGIASNMEDLQAKAARDVSERKRRRVFVGDDNDGGGAGRDNDKDQRSMMRDELYG